MSRIMLVVSIVCCSITARAAEAPVVGGTPVPLNKWRDAVVVLGRDAVCTGTLIAPDVVLTAGHCIEIHPIEVITDTVDWGKPGGDRIKVKWSRAYPDWEHRYDVGVIMLEHVARGKPRTVAAACTARTELVAGAMVHLVGFGATTKAGDDPNTALREASVPVIDPTCTTDPACEPSIAPRGEFMAGGHGADSCFGDSGGPVYLDTASGPALIGVVSRGLSLPGAPCGNGGIYVRADKVVSWIQSVTGAKLTRTTCAGRADGEDEEAPGDGGCSTGTGAGLGGGLAALAALRARRRRRT
jgi:secreted trypsin-like serine protease